MTVCQLSVTRNNIDDLNTEESQAPVMFSFTLEVVYVTLMEVLVTWARTNYFVKSRCLFQNKTVCQSWRRGGCYLFGNGLFC